MAAAKLFIGILLATLAVNVIFAEEEKPSGNEQNGEHQDRLFWSRLVGCDYSTQAGSTCRSCRQTIRCLSNGIGIVRTCRGFQQYCNNGRCSSTPGSLCSSATSSSSSSSTSSSTTSSSTTTSTTTTTTTTPAPQG